MQVQRMVCEIVVHQVQVFSRKLLKKVESMFVNPDKLDDYVREEDKGSSWNCRNRYRKQIQEFYRQGTGERNCRRACTPTLPSRHKA